MGQYFVVVNVDKKIEIEHDTSVMGGYKLCEHSYLGNPLALYLREMLASEWKGDRILHIGDYACPQDGTTTGDLLQEYLENGLWEIQIEHDECGDEYKNQGIKINKHVSIPKEFDDENFELGNYRYVINLDDKIYIDYKKIIPMEANLEISKSGKTGELWLNYFDPLLLLTACGNGQGGGDYYLNHQDAACVGAWAGKRLVATNNEDELSGYTEVIYKFSETEQVDNISPELIVSSIVNNLGFWKMNNENRLQRVNDIELDKNNLKIVIKNSDYYNEIITQTLGLKGFKKIKRA